MKHASDAPAGAPFSGRNDFPRVRSAEQLPRESIHETVTVDPGIPVRCFTYEDAGILVPAHWHHSLEILLIESGGMTVTLNDARLSLHAQDFVLINSGDLHSTNCPEHSRVRVLQIPYPFLKQNIPEYDRLRFRSGPCGIPETDAAFRHLLRSLQECRETDGLSAPPISSSARSLHFKSLTESERYGARPPDRGHGLCKRALQRTGLPARRGGGRRSESGVFLPFFQKKYGNYLSGICQSGPFFPCLPGYPSHGPKRHGDSFPPRLYQLQAVPPHVPGDLRLYAVRQAPGSRFCRFRL